MWSVQVLLPAPEKALAKASVFSVMIALRQVMSDEMLCIVMIGFAKLKRTEAAIISKHLRKQIHNARSTHNCKLAVERSETGSICPFTRINKVLKR